MIQGQRLFYFFNSGQINIIALPMSVGFGGGGEKREDKL
jgi:hypothetical protein